MAFGNDNEEVKKIIHDANAGMMFRYDKDPEKFFEKANYFKTDRDYTEQFDRKNITKEFGRILNLL